MVAIFSQILNMSMTGSVVILLVMLSRLILKRTPKIFSYALWSVVLFRLLCPVAFTAPISVLDVMEPEQKEASNYTSIVTYIPTTVDTQADFIMVYPEEQSVQMESVTEPEEQLLMTPMHAVALVWAAGMTGMMLYSVVQYLSLQRKLVGSMQLKGNIYLADHIDTAFVVGLIQPRIYLPSGVPEKERYYILAHEKHHIRRGDHIIKLLAYLALCIHWFNPLVWIAFVLAGKDMEMSCDEAVIKKLGADIRADYSAFLLRLATHKKILFGMPLAFGEGDTKGRVLNMAKWKKPTKWFVFVCTIICICVVVICSVNPDDQSSSERYLDECRKVLESVQTSDGYEIITERENHGSFALNPTSTIHDYKHKDNWLQIHTVPDGNRTSLFAYLHVDDKYYEGMPLVENGASGDVEWKESSYQGNVQPWLASYQWDRSAVTLDSVEDTGAGTVVHLNISDQFTFGEWTIEEYDVDFIFDSNGKFLAARQIVVFPDGNGMTSTLRIISLDEKMIEVHIGLTYDDVIHLSESTDDNELGIKAVEIITYNNLMMAVLEEYESHEENGAIVLSRGGVDFGGITCWNYPDFQPSDIVDLKKEESGAPIGYMSGSSAYGDIEYDVFWDGNPDGLNEKHTFFTDGDILYDVWYDQNLISGAEAARFLGTVLLDNESNETDALNQCRSVLETIQSGSYHIAEHKSITAPGSNHKLSAAYFSHNEDWMHITYLNVGNGDMETQHRMKVNGKILYNFESPVKDNIVWSDGDISEPELPWLINHKWDESKVVFKDMHHIPDQKTITVQINEPFYVYPEESKSYIVTFFFDGSGNFLQVTLQAEVIRSNGVWTVEETQSVVSLNPETINGRIQEEYQRLFG